MSSFSTLTTEFKDLDFAMDPKTYLAEANPGLAHRTIKLTDLDCTNDLESLEGIFPPTAEQNTELTLNGKKITHDAVNDTHSVPNPHYTLVTPHNNPLRAPSLSFPNFRHSRTSLSHQSHLKNNFSTPTTHQPPAFRPPLVLPQHAVSNAGLLQ